MSDCKMAVVDFDSENFMESLTPKELCSYKRLKNEIIRNYENLKSTGFIIKYPRGLLKRKEYDRIQSKLKEYMKYSNGL